MNACLLASEPAGRPPLAGRMKPECADPSAKGGVSWRRDFHKPVARRVYPI